MDHRIPPTVLADFAIESRDLFRASLEIAKIRLAIGIGIVAILVIGLSWFFVVIGEQQILWQTSPLFIGFPLLGVVGQVLRLHAAARKYVRGLPESQRRATYMFPVNADGYDVTWGGSFSHIQWADLSKIVEKRDYFLIYLNQFDASILPKRGFHQRLDLARFRELLRSQLGAKARLQPDPEFN